MSRYKEELRNRKFAIHKKIAKQEKLRDALKFNTEEWWEEHRNLESYRIDLATINSRLENLDRLREVIPEHKIIV